MHINYNKDVLNKLEDLFNLLLQQPDNRQYMEYIGQSLSYLTDKNIYVLVIRPDSKHQDCSAMSVFPDFSSLDIIVEGILNQREDYVIKRLWEGCEDWFIEIDIRILDGDLKLTARELTALTLHEIGHVLYSNSIPHKINTIIKLEVAKAPKLTSLILSNKLFSKILALPIVNLSNMTRSKESLKKEIQADRVAVSFGYRDDLISAIDKIIKISGFSVDTSEKETQELSMFSLRCINDLIERKNHLVKKDLITILSNTSSIYEKNLLDSVMKTFIRKPFSSISENAKDELIEKTINKITDEFYMSEFFLTSTKRLKRIDPADIDYIGLEINDIRTNDDKMMIVTYIHNKLDIIDYYLDIIDSGNTKLIVPHSKKELLRMKDILNEYRVSAINKRMPEYRYNIKINYPEGYEG